MSTILTQTRPFNLDTTNAIPNGDVGYTKPVGLVYVTFFARSGEHEIFVFNDNQWVLHETLLQGEFKNIKMENISQFYVRCKVASGVMRISPKVDKSANTAIKQDLKYGKALTEAGNISQQRPSNTDILKANGSDLSFDSDSSVSVQYSTTSVFPSINSVSLETVDSDVYLVTVNGENLTKDTQLYIYDSQIDDSVAQSLSAGYLDENDSSIGEVVDLVAYSIYPEKPEASSFGSLEFIPEEGVVCVNTNQTFGNKNPISFISSYEMKIAMKGVLGVNSYSVFAKDDNGSFLHKGSFTLDISNETEEISPEGTFTAYDAVIDGDTITLDGDGDYVVYNGDFRYSDQFTISTWFKSNGNMANLDTIFSNHDGGGVANGNTVSLNPDGTLRVKTLDSGTGTNGDALNIGSNLADGNWHQLVLTWQANTTNGRKVYVDGQLIHQNNSGTPNAWRTDAGSKTYIGALWLYTTDQLLPDNFFNGQIKNFNIVNSITTAQEVADDYLNNHPAADGLEDVAVMQNGATLVDGELVLDGVDQYATLADADAYDRLAGEDVTMHLWFYANSFSGNEKMLMFKGAVGPSDWDGYVIALSDKAHATHASGDLGIKIFSTDYSGGIDPNNTIFRPAGGIAFNQWHHVAVTMKDSNDQIEVYFNGQSLGTWNAAQGLSHGNGSNLLLGGYTSSGYSLDGKMKKVTIEKSILTAEQIAALYVADAPTVEVTTPDVYFDGSSTTAQIGNQTLTLQSGVSLGTGNGKYDTNFINYGASGMTNTALLNDGIDLSTGVYTFSLWFYNKRNGDDIELVLRQHVDLANPPASTNYPIVIRPTAIGGGATVAQELGVYKRIGSTNTFYGTGFSMSDYAALSEWTHLAVVADGATSKFYVNGQKVGNDVAAVINIVVRQLGSYSRGYQTFAEGIDEFAYWDSALTPGQIATIYNSSEKLDVLTPPPPLPTPDLYFDGSSADAQIGTNSFSLGGAILSTSKGKYGSDSFDFDSTGGKSPLELSTGLNLSSKIYTFSLWFYNKRTVNNWGSVIRGTTNNYPIITKYPDTDELGNYSGSFRGTGFMMTQFENLQEWTHLVVVANGTTSTYYVNGQQAGNPVNFVVSGIVDQFGSHNGTGGTVQTFAEALDEIAYWDSELTPGQIATIYNSSEKLYTPPPLPTPDLYLDGSSVTPQIGNPSDVVNLGSATLVTNNGRYDSKSFNFGTSGNKAPIRLNNLDLSTGIYSVSLWFYNKRGGSDFGSILRQSGTGSNSAYYPAGTHQTTNELGLHLGATSTASPDYGFRSTGYDMTSFEGLQEWSHLVVVADGTNTTFYINGQQAGNVVPHVVATHLREIGAYDGNDTQVFAQALDEFAYWGSALTADHVAEIYNSSTKLGGLVTEAPASQDLEESANTTLVANATVTNGILDLDGTDDYLSIPHDVAYDRESGDMSVMLWFKPRAVGYLSTLISKGTGNPSWDGWIVAVTEDDLSATDLNGNSMANGGFRFFNSAGSTNDIKYLAPTGGISLNQWHHMTLVMKAAGAYEFYYDGNLLGTFTPSSKSTTTNTELLMGANKDGGSQPAYNRMFNGMIDGVTIVKEALTSDQIAAAYNVGLNSGTYDAVISELASVVNAQSNGTLNQGATVVNDMYLDPNTRGQGFVQGTWTSDMRPDNSADDFSFSGYWRIKTANDADRGWLFGRDGSVSDGGWGIFLKKRSATTVAYEIVMAGGNPTFITDDITTNVYDEFHHISFTYSNGEWKFYHDGVLVYTKTGVNMPTTNPSGGKYKLGNGWAVLALDEINLFKGTYLSTSQITSLAGERSQKDTDYTNNT